MVQYTQETLDKLHQTLVDILSEVIRVCNENDIPYFVDYGTLLGAIRHNGFIPWDDDIDITMLRDDYERFLKIAPKALKEGYILQHYSTDPGVPISLAKVRKNGTKFVEEQFKKVKMHHGAYIDIFVLDKIPVDKRRQTIYRRKMVLLEMFFRSKVILSPLSSLNYPRKEVIRFRILYAILRLLLLPIPRKLIWKWHEKAARKYNNTNSPLVSHTGATASIRDISNILPLKEHIFENITVKIPADSDKLLSTTYGNYMELPPEDKRVTHAPYELEI